jgi:hypothetical protein
LAASLDAVSGKVDVVTVFAEAQAARITAAEEAVATTEAAAETLRSDLTTRLEETSAAVDGAVVETRRLASTPAPAPVLNDPAETEVFQTLQVRSATVAM